MLSDLWYIHLPICYVEDYLSKFPPVLWMPLAKNSLYFQFIMLELLFDFSRGEVSLMTRLKDLIENCRWALPTACLFSCKEQSQAALPYPCVLLQGLLSASHPGTKPFSFYYYWRLWLFFNFLSFVAGMSSICFSVIDSCSHFSPPAFGRALCSAELCQCLQLLELCLCSSCLCPTASACPQHPGHCPCLLSSLGPNCAVNHTSLRCGIPSFHCAPSCLSPVLWASRGCALEADWSACKCLWHECLSFQSALTCSRWFQAPRLVFCISYCSNEVTPWCLTGTKDSALWLLRAWVPA